MFQNGIDSMKIDGKLCYTKVDEYYSVNKAKFEDAKEWFFNNGLSWLIGETVNAKTLSSEMKKRKQGEEEIPKDLLSIRTCNRVGIKKG